MVKLTFCVTSPLSLKNGQMRPQNSFLQFPQKIFFIPRKLFNVKIRELSQKKGSLRFIPVMTTLTLINETQVDRV